MHLEQKSYVLKEKDIKPRWWIVDLEGKTLGRIATRIADVLRGKIRATFTPNTDAGDFVVAINAEKIKLTGKKWDDKIYYRHSGYPGGLRERTAKELLAKHPEDLIIKAVKGMLPKNFLSAQLLTKLKVYAGSEHPHEAQQPKPFDGAQGERETKN